MMRKVRPGRIAIRSEGNLVNFYIAKIDTMEEAILIMSASRRLLDDDRELFEAMKQGAQRFLDGMIVEAFGVHAESWQEERAPEHEKAGSA